MDIHLSKWHATEIIADENDTQAAKFIHIGTYVCFCCYCLSPPILMGLGTLTVGHTYAAIQTEMNIENEIQNQPHQITIQKRQKHM